ncbi:MAG: type II secretion system protein GspD [Alphaproteobacteria bacterium]
MSSDLIKAVFVKKGFRVLLAFACVFSLSACDLAKNYTKPDRAADIEIQDFRDGLADRLPEVDENKASSEIASIPELQPYVSMTSSSIEAMPLVSVSVNQSVPIKDILYELAQQAEYDIELDPNIRGSIIFTARNKPFDMVVKRISEISGLRYKFEDSFLRVEVDKPYNKTYKIDYLSFIRSNQGAVSSAVSVVSGEGADTGSSYSATSDSVSDFWGELEANMAQILGGASQTLKTNRDPRITAVEQNPEIAAVSPQQGAGGVQVQPPEAVLRVESLPVDDADTAPSMGAEESGNGYTFSLNKQAGMINVYANEYTQKEIDAYLSSLRKSVTSQVLVEAKVFEVSLYDEYINGIEWGAITNDNKGIVRFLEGVSGSIGDITAPGGDIATISNFGVGYLGGEVSAFIEAISGFGTVRALASPRLTVMNNQSAVLNVATNRVFFEIDLDRETDDDTGDVTLEIDSEIKSVPEGVLINVQPSINLENKTISMFIRPTVTRIVGTVSDPSVQFVAGDTGIVSEIPEVNVQEIDTVVKVNSGQPIVMGGLLQDRAVANNENIPVVGEIPLFGSLFRKQKDLVSKTELVVFLKATLIEDGNDTIHNTDRDLYKAFSGDRRPLKM